MGVYILPVHYIAYELSFKFSMSKKKLLGSTYRVSSKGGGSTGDYPFPDHPTYPQNAQLPPSRILVFCLFFPECMMALKKT